MEEDNMINENNRIRSYESFLEKTKPLSHFCIKREGKYSYFHHFMVLGIFKIFQGSDQDVKETRLTEKTTKYRTDGIDAVTLVHYTSSPRICSGYSSSLGKLIRETFLVSHKSRKSRHGDGTVDLLDFENEEIYLLDYPDYPKSEEGFRKAYKRLDDRLGEQNYSLSYNNCESVINHVLTGRSQSKQAQKRRPFVDCIQTVFVDIKNVGFKTAILVSLLGAVAGSLVRRAYVRMIVIAVVSYSAKMALESNCLKSTGSNIVREAMRRVNQSEQILSQKKQPHEHLQVLSEIRSHLNNSGFICNMTKELAEEAHEKTFQATLIISLSFETVIFMTFARFNLCPLYGSLSNIEFTRVIVLHTVSGYSSLVLSAFLGLLSFRTLMRPALKFFFIVLVSGVFLRYVFTVIVGFLFDAMTICRCCRSCNGKCKSKFINRFCKCLCNPITFGIFCLAIVCTVSVLTVKYYLR